MSKQTTPTTKEANDNKRTKALVKAFKTLKGYGKLKLPPVSPIMIFLLIAGGVLWFIEPTAGLATHAALYAFANDGVISGRQSNSVKTRNGIERMFVVPSLVRTTYTNAARNILAGLSAGWNALTDAQRLSWTNAEGNFKTNRLGRSILIKGKALFVERNANNTHAGGGGLIDYPGVDGIIFNTVVTGTFTQTAGLLTAASVAFDESPVATDTAYEIWATAPKSAGTNRPKLSAYRFIQIVPAAGTTPANILTSYIARFGSAANVDQKIGVYIKVINLATGQAGIPLGEVASVV